MDKCIYTKKGVKIIVSEQDYEYLEKLSWTITRGGYPYNRDGYMHRIIMQTPKGMLTDHINGNRLDNRRENLRICTHRQNNMNRRKVSKINQYKGYTYDKSRNKYQAMIRVDGKNKHLGRFNTSIEAAIAYNNAAKLYYGDFSLLNEF